MRRFDLKHRPRISADNRCVKCGHEWHDRPIGFARHQECPNCGSLYWVWTNYRAQRRQDP